MSSELRDHAPAKPIPVPDEVTRPFWQAAREGRLVIQRCDRCKLYFHPPVGLCPECLSSELAFQPVSGLGRVNAFTVTYSSRQPAFAALQPYLVAVVELDEQKGLFLYSNLPGCPVDRVHVGMRVTVEFEEIDAAIAIPQFRPIEVDGQALAATE